MAVGSVSATESARRLWTRAAAGADGTQEVGEAAERLCERLGDGLVRWIGVQGYRALLDRALVETLQQHPALGSLQCLNGDEPITTIALRPHGAAEVAAGMIALTAVLIELLGKIVGNEMAVRLVEQSATLNPPVLTTDRKAGRDG